MEKNQKRKLMQGVSLLLLIINLVYVYVNHDTAYFTSFITYFIRYAYFSSIVTAFLRTKNFRKRLYLAALFLIPLMMTLAYRFSMSKATAQPISISFYQRLVTIILINFFLQPFFNPLSEENKKKTAPPTNEA